MKKEFSVTSGEIEIRFGYFNTKWDSKCRRNYIQFRDGNGNKFGNKLCGKKMPHDLPNIPTSKASVYMKSSGRGSKLKFRFCYQPGKKGYDGNIFTY